MFYRIKLELKISIIKSILILKKISLFCVCIKYDEYILVCEAKALVHYLLKTPNQLHIKTRIF